MNQISAPDFFKRYEKIIIPAILSVLITILFHGVFNTYAFTDDYEFLLNAGNPNFIDVFITGGRPITGVLLKWAFTSFNTVEEAYKIRLISLIGAVLYANIFYFFLRKEKLSLALSLFITLLLICSPSFGIKVLWSLGFTMPYTSILALLSGICFVKAAKDLRYAFPAMILGIIVLLIYQPLYTLSIIPLFVRWIRGEGEHSSIIKILVLHLLTYFLYYVLFKLSLIWFELPALDRSGVNLNLIERTWWFITGPLEQALTYNFLFYKRAILWAVFSLSIVSAFSIIISLWKKKEDFRYLLYLIPLVGLSMLPNIISSDNWVSYRTMGPLIIVLIIIYGFSIQSIKGEKWRYPLFLMIAILCYANAYYNVNSGFINIQTKEYSCLKTHIVDQGLDNDHYLFIQPEVGFLDDKDMIERVITDEYGRLSTSSDWVPGPMIKLIYRANHKTLPTVDVINEADKIRSDHTVLNMPYLYLECRF